MSLCGEGTEFDPSSNTCQEMMAAVDACASSPCGTHRVCHQTKPGEISSNHITTVDYHCECNSGFTFDGTTCVDVDECDEGKQQ